MKKLLILSLSILIGFCFTACGNGTATEPIEETTTTTIEETKAEAEPITKEDFIAKEGNESEDVDILAVLDETGEDYSYQFYYYDPAYDESKEGVIKTHRGVVLGDSKEVVSQKYGKGTSGDFDTDNDYCYDYSKNVDFHDGSGETDISPVMRAQCVSYERYTFEKYTISFYFNEDNEVSWIWFTRKE